MMAQGHLQLGISSIGLPLTRIDIVMAGIISISTVGTFFDLAFQKIDLTYPRNRWNEGFGVYFDKLMDLMQS